LLALDSRGIPVPTGMGLGKAGQECPGYHAQRLIAWPWGNGIGPGGLVLLLFPPNRIFLAFFLL